MREKKYLTLADASKIMKISPQSIRLKIKSGEIPFTQPGKQYLLLEEDVYKWIETKHKK